MASCESIEVPAGQPTNERRPWINKSGGNSIGSSDAPIITRFLLTARLPRISLMAFAHGTVASMTLALHNLLSSSTAFCERLFIYCFAPNFFTSPSSSFPLAKDDLSTFIHLYRRIKKEKIIKQDITNLLQNQQKLKYMNKRVELYNDFIGGQLLQIQ